MIMGNEPQAQIHEHKTSTKRMTKNRKHEWNKKVVGFTDVKKISSAAKPEAEEHLLKIRRS